MKETINHSGKVILAAAGPGDPELLTLKAYRYLQVADVVITDRLVSEIILDEYTNPQATIIHVGKQCRRGTSVKQSQINELLVQHASEGKLVVRLKGGDVSIFSNMLDELEALRLAGISFEILPGVTAALGAAAYSGIPLTARNYSTAVRLLTFYKSDLLPEAYWQELSKSTDTLVFYMSSDTLEQVVEKFRLYGVEKKLPIAVIEQATTPYQRVYLSNFENYEAQLKGLEFLSPTLIIIGAVAALHEQYAWLPEAAERQYYFPPLPAKQINYTPIERKNRHHVNRA